MRMSELWRGVVWEECPPSISTKVWFAFARSLNLTSEGTQSLLRRQRRTAPSSPVSGVADGGQGS